MSMLRLSILSFFMMLATSCGINSWERDLRSEENRRKEAEEKNKKLDEENDSLKRKLAYVMDTENYFWIFIGTARNAYSEAASLCAGLNTESVTPILPAEQTSWSIPDEKAYKEFIAQIYNKKENLKKSIKPEQFHIKDKTQNLTEGVVVCKRDKVTATNVK